MSFAPNGCPAEERRILDCSLPSYNMVVYLQPDETVLSPILQGGDVLLINRALFPLPGESVIVCDKKGDIHHLGYDDYQRFAMKGSSFFGVLVGYVRPTVMQSRGGPRT